MFKWIQNLFVKAYPETHFHEKDWVRMEEKETEIYKLTVISENKTWLYIFKIDKDSRISTRVDVFDQGDIITLEARAPFTGVIVWDQTL